jgi:HemY protein
VQLEIRIHEHLLDWDKVPRSLKKNARLLVPYCHTLMQQEKDDEAAKLLWSALNEHWDEDLMTCYGFANASHPKKQLEQAEYFLKQHPHNPVLLLALGRIAIRFKYWAKAEEYLKAGLAIKPLREAYCQLGFLYERINDKNKAFEAYKLGAEL